MLNETPLLILFNALDALGDLRPRRGFYAL
jgi:hypothetical protein